MVGALLFGILLSALLNTIVHYLVADADPSQLRVHMENTRLHFPPSPHLLIQTLILAPIIEEMIFRLYIDPWLKQPSFLPSACPSFLLSSLVFSLSHLHALHVLFILNPLAWLLALITLMVLSQSNAQTYQHNQQISLPILSHLGFNLCTWILYLPHT